MTISALQKKETASERNQKSMKAKFLTQTCRVAAAVLFTLSGVLTVRADYSNTVGSLGPLGYWRLNETAASPALNKVANLGSIGSAGDGYIVLDVGKAEAGKVNNCIRLNNAGNTV